MAVDFPLYEILGLVLVVCFIIGLAKICVKFTKSKNPFFSKEYKGSAETIYAIEELKEKYFKGKITREEFYKMTEEKIGNDPNYEKTREGIQDKYHDGEIIRENIPVGIRIKRELGSLIGITTCKKCGTRTKIKYTESLDKIGDEWIGYAICPKCGNKEKWLSGDDGAGGGA